MADNFDRFKECAVKVLSVDAAKVTMEASFADDLDGDACDLEPPRAGHTRGDLTTSQSACGRCISPPSAARRRTTRSDMPRTTLPIALALLLAAVGSTSADYAKFIEAEQKIWKNVVERTGMKPD